MHVNFRMKFSCTRNLQRTYKLTKNLPELYLSFRARSYCSPPNLHSFSWLNAHQEHRGHVLRNRDDRGQCEAFNTLLNAAIYEKALISLKSILLILVTSIYFFDVLGILELSILWRIFILKCNSSMNAAELVSLDFYLSNNRFRHLKALISNKKCFNLM